MPFNVVNALRIGQFVNAAYSPSATMPISYPVPAGYQMLQPIYGNDLATDIGGPKSTVPFGFIAGSAANDLVVAIRGTEGIWEWIQDAKFLREPCPFPSGPGTTEDGFSDVYKSLKVGSGPSLVAELKTLLAAAPGVTLTIAGHSLGAALATLLALDVVTNVGLNNPLVITFASPLVGDATFAAAYNRAVANTWRVANAVDIITRLPPAEWGFVDVNQLFPVNSFTKVKLVPTCAHALNTYLYLLDQIVGDGAVTLNSACALSARPSIL